MDATTKPVDLVKMVEYQKDGVVSKTVVDKKVGTITLFAFDHGQGLSEHTAPYDAFVHVLDGAVEIHISGRPYQLRAGDMILMPANQPHSLKALQPFKMMLVMIRA